MAIFGLFGEKKGKLPEFSGPLDPKWAQNAKGNFHNLLHIDPDEVGVRGTGGVYVIWHGGVRPQWVYIGESQDIGGAIDDAVDNPEILDYQVHGAMFVTWSAVVEEFRPGVVAHLTQTLKPVVSNPQTAKDESDGVEPILVYTPGGGPE